MFCRAWTFSCRAGGTTLADDVRILKLALNSGAACGPHRHDYHFSEALRAAASSHLRASGLRWAVSARVVVFVYTPQADRGVVARSATIDPTLT